MHGPNLYVLLNHAIQNNSKGIQIFNFFFFVKLLFMIQHTLGDHSGIFRNSIVTDNTHIVSTVSVHVISNSLMNVDNVLISNTR